jgi:hypothetical protein
MLAAYKALDRLYRSARPAAEKLAEKAKIIDQLVDDLHLRWRPGNSSLVELRVYQASGDGFARVEHACGGVAAMIAAGKRLKRADFTQDLQDDLRPVLARMVTLCRQGVPPSTR